jgi:hypothetical protein
MSAGANGGLRTLDPPLSPSSTPVEIFWRTCLGGGGHFSFFREKNPQIHNLHSQQNVLKVYKDPYLAFKHAQILLPGEP